MTALPYCSSSRLQLASTSPRHSSFTAVSPSVLLLRLSCFRAGLLCSAALRASTTSAVSSQYSSLQEGRKAGEKTTVFATSHEHGLGEARVARAENRPTRAETRQCVKTDLPEASTASPCSFQEVLILKLESHKTNSPPHFHTGPP